MSGAIHLENLPIALVAAAISAMVTRWFDRSEREQSERRSFEANTTMVLKATEDDPELHERIERMSAHTREQRGWA